MATYFWIGLGSALGGIGRHLVSVWSVKHWGVVFPWGTLIVNVLGSFLIGLVSVWVGSERRLWLGIEMQQFLMIGFFGGFTTFSSFSLQNLNLLQTGEWQRALANIFLSLTLCLFSVWLGWGLGKLIGFR
ncbi:MAG: fluoride efflux transporter CrcB [Verrucomicrobiae bacterium]|nr:fluoride efflux transporter CrcB [Verrucomicrobiae bacterium]